MNATMKNIITLLLFYFVGIMNVYSQRDSLPQISDRILDYYQKVPMEKIHVHTDRACYASGDTIWFRAYLIDAATNKPCNRSKFIYTELRHNVADTLVVRYKIKSDSAGIFANAIPLPQTLKSGDYTLVSYTKWMQNFSEDDFFSKEIQIVNSAESLTIPKPQERSTQKISLALMPEGGHLIDGFLQVLAFKVIDEDGLGVDANITLTDINGTVLQSAQTQHLGMGKLLIYAQSGEQLFVEAESMGRTDRVSVPEILKSGVSMSVMQHSGKVFIQPFATHDIDIESNASLVLYGVGNMLELPVISGKMIVIPNTDLRPGVLNVAIVDNNSKHVYAERLIFVRAENTSMSVTRVECNEH